MTDEEKTSDAELIETIITHIRETTLRHDTESLLSDLARRLAELTKPEPWREVSEPPEAGVDVWLRIGEDDSAFVELGYYVLTGKWHVDESSIPCVSVTGWLPIVRPEP